MEMEKDLLASFVLEMRGSSARIRQAMAAPGGALPDKDVLDDLRRQAHRIKGGASMAGCPGMSHIAYLAEQCLDQLHRGALDWSNEVREAIHGSALAIDGLLTAITVGTYDEREPLLLVVRSFCRLEQRPESEAEVEVEAVLGSHASPAPAPSAASDADQDAGFDEIPPEVVAIFWQEMEELLQKTGEGLNKLAIDFSDRETLVETRRAVHTIKGAAASMGYSECSRIAHRMEDVFDRLKEHKVEASPEIRSLLYKCYDALSEAAAAPAERAKTAESLKAIESVYSALFSAADAGGAEPAGEPAEEIPEDLLEAFRAESEEQLRSMSERLQLLPDSREQGALLLEVRRTVHTLKGASNMIGRRRLAELSHLLEDLFQSCASGSRTYTADIHSLSLDTCDLLLDLVQARKETPAMGAAFEQIKSRFAALGAVTDEPAAPLAVPPAPAFQRKLLSVASGEPAANEASTQQVLDPVAPSLADGDEDRKSSHMVRVPIEKLDELVRLVGELVVNRSNLEQWRSRYARSIEELGMSNSRLHRVSSRLDTEYEVSALGRGFGQLAVRGLVIDAQRDFDDLEFDRYSDFHLFSRDLAEISTDIGTASSDLGQRTNDFDSYTHRMGRLVSELQDKLMRLRMVPLSTILHRMQRTVRVTAEKKEKLADLVVEGRQVELDRVVLEEMSGPIEHILRNATDHGLESPALRRAMGKPERGRITVKAYYEGTYVVVEIADDGAGLQHERIRATAVKLGLYTEKEAANLDPNELVNLIFEHGFSTAGQVSEISGRGVGMDVVKSTVNRLKGNITVETTAGAGTRFIIRLPMTLAITRVLLLKSSEQLFAIPLGVVKRIMWVEEGQIEKLGGKLVLRYQKQVVPVAHLSDVLKLKKPPRRALADIPVVVLQVGRELVALQADELLEVREVMVKTLGNVLVRVKGITGSTLTGDGKVVLILNPSELLEQAPTVESRARRTAAPAAIKHQLDVLIVDDSVSVRRLLSNLVTRSGWKASSAKDGVDALEYLQRTPRRPDVVLLDIEMPRMDGYELLATLRGQSAFRDLPIIMLTSRAGEKHRAKAFELGASDYLVKPYQEEELLQTVRKVTRTLEEAPSA